MGKSTNRPENAKYGTIYFIRHNSGAFKIGITLDWKRRSKDLKVGKECKALCVKKVANPRKLEKALLNRYESNNLPGTEWLNDLKVEDIEEIKKLINDQSKKYEQVFKKRKKENVDLKMTMSPESVFIRAQLEQERERNLINKSAEARLETERRSNARRLAEKHTPKKSSGFGDRILLSILTFMLVAGLLMGAGSVVVIFGVVLWPILLILLPLLLYLKITKKF